MSRPNSEHRTLSVTDEKAANFQAASPTDAQMAQNQEPVPEFADSSGPLFAMYCSTEKDYKSAEFLKTGADTLIVFLGLFSATVATILAVTFQELSPNPQDTSAFYLENIYKLQLLGDSNTSLPSVPAQLPPFSPPIYAICVNTLLSLSMCLNLFIAIVAIAEWRWMSLGILIAGSPQEDPHHRARIQEVVANEYYIWRAPITWFLTIMVYLAAWCFFTGLAIYGFYKSRGVFAFVFPVGWICAFAFCIFEYCLSAVHRSKSSTKIDDRVLHQLFKTLVKDSDFIKFFENIPGFCRSSVVRDPIRRVTKLGKEKLHMAVKSLLERTWSSDLPNSEKLRRLVMCVNVADSVRLPCVAHSILQEIFPRDLHGVLQSVDSLEMGHSLRTKSSGTQQEIGLCAQSIVAGIISNVQESNDSWVALAADQLNKTEDVIRGYLERGNDNVMLANLTHITRQIFHSSEDNSDMALESSSILPLLSNFDVRNTLPELQGDFRALWNKIKQAPNDNVSREILESLLDIYNALPQSTVDVSTTPPNPSGSTSPVYGAVDENDQTHTITSPLLADDPPLCGILEVTQRTTAAALTGPTPPRGIRGRSGTSKAVVSSATIITDNLVNIPL